MKNYKKATWILPLLAVIMTAVLLGCPLGGTDPDPDPDPDTNVAVTGVTLSQNAATLVLLFDPSVTLTATVAPANATNKDVTWSSSDEAVATVSAEGVVTAVSVGTANITVTTDDGDNTDAAVITVTEAELSVLWDHDFEHADWDNYDTTHIGYTVGNAVIDGEEFHLASGEVAAFGGSKAFKGSIGGAVPSQVGMPLFDLSIVDAVRVKLAKTADGIGSLNFWIFKDDLTPGDYGDGFALAPSIAIEDLNETLTEYIFVMPAHASSWTNHHLVFSSTDPEGGSIAGAVYVDDVEYLVTSPTAYVTGPTSVNSGEAGTFVAEAAGFSGALNYAWTMADSNGTLIDLTGTTTDEKNFTTPPAPAETETYTVSVVVSDGTDTVTASIEVVVIIELFSEDFSGFTAADFDDDEWNYNSFLTGPATVDGEEIWWAVAGLNNNVFTGGNNSQYISPLMDLSQAVKITARVRGFDDAKPDATLNFQIATFAGTADTVASHLLSITGDELEDGSWEDIEIDLSGLDRTAWTNHGVKIIVAPYVSWFFQVTDIKILGVE